MVPMMTCCHYVIFKTYFDRVQGNMNGPEALKSEKTTKSLKQQNVTRLREACHDCEEGSRRTLGCYKIVTRLDTGVTRFLDQKIFPI